MDAVVAAVPQDIGPNAPMKPDLDPAGHARWQHGCRHILSGKQKRFAQLLYFREISVHQVGGRMPAAYIAGRYACLARLALQNDFPYAFVMRRNVIQPSFHQNGRKNASQSALAFAQGTPPLAGNSSSVESVVNNSHDFV